MREKDYDQVNLISKEAKQHEIPNDTKVKRDLFTSFSSSEEDIIDTKKTNSYDKNQLIRDETITRVSLESPEKMTGLKATDQKKYTDWVEELSEETRGKLAAAEDLISTMEADHDSASRYKRVRKAIAIYRGAKGLDEKLRALDGIYKSAKYYLMERTDDSYEARKVNCEKLTKNMASLYKSLRDYGHKIDFTREDYILNHELSDDMARQEIQFAYKMLHWDKKALGSVSNKRLKAFRLKINETRKANALLEKISQSQTKFDDLFDKAKKNFDIDADDNISGDSYMGSIRSTVSTYSTLFGLDEGKSERLFKNLLAEDENKEDVSLKAKSIETILLQVLSFDPNDFKYENARDFFKKDNLGTLYDKLTLAKKATYLLGELQRLGKECDAEYDLTDEQIRELEAKIGLFSEMYDDYYARIELASNPYYALLLEEDVKKLNLEAIDDLQYERDDSYRFKTYSTTLYSRKLREDSYFQLGGEYRRGMDLAPLIKHHRRQAGYGSKNFAKEKKGDFDYKGFDSDVRLAQEARQKLSSMLYLPENKSDNLIIDIRSEEDSFDDSIEDKKNIIEDKVEDEKQKDAQKEEERIKAENAKKEEERIKAENAKKEEEERIKAENAKKEEERIKAAQRDKEELLGMMKDRSKKERKDRLFDENYQAQKLIEDTKRLEEQKKKERFRREIGEKSAKITADSGKWVSDFEKSEEAKRKSLIDRQMLYDLVTGYEALSQKGATLEDAFALKEKIVTNLMRLSGEKRFSIEFIPTDRLVEFVSYALENYDKKDIKEGLARRFKDADAGFEEAGDEVLISAAETLLSKGEEMSAKDKLLLYDHSALLICMNRSNNDGDMSYDDYKSFEAKYLLHYAKQTSAFYINDIGEDEEYEYDNLPEERRAPLMAITGEILSEYTKKEKEYFDVLPLSERMEFANTLLDITDKEAQKEGIEECLKRAGEIHERLDKVHAAIDSADRTKLISVITEFTGTDASEYRDYPLTELTDLAGAFYQEIHDLDSLKEIGTGLLEAAKNVHGADFYRHCAKEYNRIVWYHRGEFDEEPAKSDLQARSEYSILYLKEHLGFDEIDFSDYEKLTPDEVFSIIDHVDIIEALKEPADEYEKNDLARAMLSMAALKMSKRAREAYEKALGVSFDGEFTVKPLNKDGTVDTSYVFKTVITPYDEAYIQKMREEQKNRKKTQFEFRYKTGYTPEIEKEEDKKFISTIKKDTNQVKYAPESTQKRQRELDRLAARKKKQQAAVEKSWGNFTQNTYKMLDFMGELTTLSTGAALDSGLAGRTKEFLLNNIGIFVTLLSKDSDHIRQFDSIFKELKNGVAKHERRFVEEFEKALEPLVNALQKNVIDIRKKKKYSFGDTVVKKALNLENMNKEIEDFSGKLEQLFGILEQDFISVMEQATSDIFGQLREKEEGIPSINDLMPAEAKAIVNDINRLNKKAMQDEAKTLRQKQKLLEKGEDQKREERKQLDYMSNSLLYDRNRGQGKFIQTLVSGYYKNANKADKRRMLSYIIKDMKKVSSGVSEKEIGCTYFASTMKGAGPIMQKMMQGVPERMVIPEMSGALNLVKSSLTHIDEEYVNQVFERIKKESGGKVTVMEDIKSLGAASVAETFSCVIKGPKIKDQKVVVKIKRPGLKERIKAEEDFIIRASMYADMTDKQIADYEKKYGKVLVPHERKVTESGFLAQYEQIKKEFDFKNEINNVNLGYENYYEKYDGELDKKKKKNKKEDEEKRKNVKSVTVNKNFAPSSDYMVMDMAEGRTVDKVTEQCKENIRFMRNTYKNADPTIKSEYSLNSHNVANFWVNRANLIDSAHKSIRVSRLLENLAYIWVEQALYGSALLEKNGDNFHHGDLHAGNIMVTKHHATVLDYGNCVILKDDKINLILSMMSSVVINRADLFVDCFDKLLEICEEEERKQKAADAAYEKKLEKAIENAKKKKKPIPVDTREKKEYIGFEKMSDETKAVFIKKLTKLFDLGSAADSGKKIMIALNVAQELGVKLPKEIQTFSQCQQRLENTLLEVNNIAVTLCNCVKTLDNLPVSEDEKDSFDPMIQLHLLIRGKRDSDKPGIIEKLQKKYETEEAEELIFGLSNINTEKDARDAIKEYFPGYFAITKDKKKTHTPKELQARAKDWRKSFNKVLELKKIGQQIPQQLRDELDAVRNEILRIFMNNEYLESFISSGELVQATANALGGNRTALEEFSEADFERFMVVFENIVPSVYDAGNLLEAFVKNKNNTEFIKEVQPKMSGIITKAVNSQIYGKPLMVDLLTSLRKAKESKEGKEELDRRIYGFLSRHSDLKTAYGDIFKLQMKLDDAIEKKRLREEELKKEEKEWDPKEEKAFNAEIKKQQDTLDAKETFFLSTYLNESNTEFDEVKKNFYEGFTEKEMRRLLSDFVGVMGQVINDHLTRSLFKLETEVTKAVKKKMDDDKELADKIKAEEEKIKNEEEKKKKKKK